VARIVNIRITLESSVLVILKLLGILGFSGLAISVLKSIHIYIGELASTVYRAPHSNPNYNRSPLMISNRLDHWFKAIIIYLSYSASLALPGPDIHIRLTISATGPDTADIELV